MTNPHSDYANVVDFGAKPNSFLDDTEAFLNAVATGRSVFVPAGIYYISQTLKIENQNLIGCGSFQTQIVSINTEKSEPIIMAGRSCKISDILITYKEGIVTGEEKEGEYVGILMHGENWPLQRASSIRDLRIANVGTCLYMPKGYSGGGPFSVEHANLEMLNFTYSAIDYGMKHCVGNVFFNIFIISKFDVEYGINLYGDSSNLSMSHIVFIQTRCRKAALSLTDVKGFHISSCHFGNTSVTERGHGIIELKNSSGEVGAMSFNYIPLDCKDSSLIRLYDANYDLSITEKEIVPSNHYLKIGNLDVCSVNDPSISPQYPERSNEGLVAPYDKQFKFISRKSGSKGIYYVEIGNYSYYSFKDDKEAYENFACDDSRISFIKKGALPLGGPSSQRPRHRLCKYVSEYFDTDLGRKVYWDGEKWV